MTTTAPRRSRAVGTTVLVVGVAAALFAASRLSGVLFERPARIGGAAGQPASAAAAAAGADEGGIFQVTSAEGRVDAYRDGRWIAIERGDLLTSADVVRTVAGARAVLRLSAGTEIELRERVEVRLDRLSAAGASVDLRRGKVVARVSSSGDALAITARETRTSNDGPAHFVVMADEHGQVSVAALKGTARFAAAGKTVAVPEGHQTRSRLGEPPDDPEKIPEEVLLQVVWPAGERHGDTASVEGHAGRSSLVTVNGTPAAVQADGKFAATVPLREGSNVVEVQAEDLSGRTGSASTTLVRRPVRPPKLAPEPAELWKR
jgi:hypothetical protein